jgi:hypothetical protein
MDLRLSYDGSLDAWVLTHDDVRIEREEDIEVWHSILLRELQKLGGERAYILIDIAEFHLAPALAERYGKVAKRVISEHALGIVRFGHSDHDMTTTAIRLGAVLNRFPANVFPNREAALEVLARIRTLPPAVAR